MSAPSPDVPVSYRSRMLLFLALVVARWLWAASFGPSDGELLVWASQDFAGPFPAPFGLVALVAPGVALLGDNPAALRGLFALLSAVPVLLVGRHPAAIALAASLPVLTVPGALATPAAPMAVLWLGAVRAARSMPALAGVLTGLTASLHPTGLLLAIPTLTRTRRKLLLAGTAALVAGPFLPGSFWSTTLSLTGELSPTGLAVAAVVFGGPFLLIGTIARLFDRGQARWMAAGSLFGVIGMVAVGAPAPLLAGPLALSILAVVPDSEAPDGSAGAPLGPAHRVVWPNVGIAAVVAVALAAILRLPVVQLPIEVRARFADTATLAQAVASWDIPTVYALSPADIARLRWHGLRATSPPPIHPLDLPDDIALVMPQSADPDLPFHMGWDHDREGVYPVVVHIDTPDPTVSRPAAAWNLTIWTRPIERRSTY